MQVVGHLLRRPVAVGRLLAQRLQDDRLQRGGDGSVQLAERGRIVVGDLLDQRVAVAALEWGAERQQLVERRAQRVDVAAMVDDPAPGEDLLGARVAERAQELARDREPGIADDLGQAEVGDPELRPEVQQQVARLDVPMHDPRLVGVLQRQRRLPPQPGHPIEIPAAVRRPFARDRRRGERDLARQTRLAERPREDRRRRPGRRAPPSAGDGREPCSIAQAAQLRDQRGEALPLDELHRVIVDAALAADRMHRHDLLVLHVRGRQRLGLESLEAARVDGRGERQHLERDPPPERDLLGLVDDPHPPPAHLAQETKVAELADARGDLVRPVARRADRARRVACPRGTQGRREPCHLVVAGEERLQVLPEVGVLGQELAPVGLSARLECLDVVQQDLVPPLLPFGVAGEFMTHGPTPPASRSSSRSRFSPRKSRPTAAGRVRPICSATSATASPFR